ncbi:two-component regulator propeller domain-containing protein [Limibacter armeniacum]|uniref:hybrid sensor histidine kinase/response regulator transcription factor n=1 Tax=Limibacter armeniacum TaxID=466084 RepID=UPI002FE5E213
MFVTPKHFRHLLLVSGLLIFSAFSFAQQLNFKHLMVEDGLSQTSVLAFLEDRQGFVWIGTRDGLNRYDGHEVKVFRHEVNDSTSLSGNVIRDIAQDRFGNIWVGTNMGISLYDELTGGFQNFLLYGMGTSGLKGSLLHVLETDQEGNLWVGMDNGIYRYDSLQKTFMHEERLSAYDVMSIFQDHEGHFWIGTSRSGVLLYNPDSESVMQFQHEQDNPKSISNNFVYRIYEDSQNRLWFCTGEGVSLLQKDKGSFIRYQYDPTSPLSLCHNTVRDIVEDREGNLWFGTFKGISILKKGADGFESHTYHPEYISGLSHESVHALMRDRRGSIWIGTYFGGVNIYDPYLNQFSFYGTDNLYKEKGVSFRVVGPMAVDNNQQLWIGTEGKGINKLDLKTGKFEHLDTRHFDVEKVNVKSLCWSSDNKLWIGLHRGGIFIYDPSRKSYKEFAPEGRNYRDNAVLSIKESGDRVLLATHLGLDIYNKANGKVNRVKLHGEQTVEVRDVIVDKDGNIWFATESKGVFSYNEQAGIIHHYPTLGENTNGLTSNFTCTLMESSDGHIWIGTKSGGLNCLDKQTGKFTYFTAEDGLPSNSINAMVEDQDGAIWISTLKGISRYQPDQGTFTTFRCGEMIPVEELNERALVQAGNGQFFVGSMQGLVAFNAGQVSQESYEPPVTLTWLKVNNQKIYPSDESGILEKPLSASKKITLTYEHTNFSLGYTALDFLNSPDTRFAYRLEGLDKDWINSESNYSVGYANLAAGNYTFRLRLEGAKDQEVSLQIEVLPAPYFTWWAYLLYAFAAFGLILLFRNYTIRIEKMKHSLELAEVERNKLEELSQMKLQFFTNISHEFRTPLTLIMTPIRSLLENRKADKETRHKLDMVYRNSQRLYNLINELMDFRKQETGHLKLQMKEESLLDFLQHIHQLFQDHATHLGVDFQLNLSESAPVWIDSYQMEKVMVNLLSNAFKFTEKGGAVRLASSLSADGKSVEISVTDTGKGIRTENLDSIFERFYQVEGDKRLQSLGSGVGLALTKGIVEMHGGKIQVESEEGKGTVFRISLRLSDSHIPIELKQAQIEKEENKEMDGLSILIVDDNQDMRSLVGSCFDASCKLLEAEDGEQGFELALKHTPNLIISDVMMPGISGTELCRKLKRHVKTAHIPVLLLTAKHGKDAKLVGLEAGADDYVTKPFDANLLRVRCKNLIRSHQVLLKRMVKAEKTGLKQENSMSLLDDKLVRDVRNVISKHLADPDLNVNLLAKEVGVGRTMLFTKLKSLTGQTPNDLILQYRLEKASEMLMADKSRSVSEVCYAVGFNSPKYFSKCFQKQYGHSPTQYITLFAD